MWIIGESDSAIAPSNDLQLLPLVEVAHGAPRVHVSHVRILGRLRVAGGELTLSSCSIEANTLENDETTDERGVSIFHGDVTMIRTTLSGHRAGALSVRAARLTIIECAFRDNHARSGGAVLVRDESIVIAIRSNFTDNRATASGGALQVNQDERSFPGHPSAPSPQRIHM